LSNEISEKGESNLQGVYLKNVRITVDASAYYNYKVNADRLDPTIRPSLFSSDLEWFQTLVELRNNPRQEPKSLPFGDGIFQVVTEGPNVCTNVFLPFTNTEIFPYHVVVFQNLTNCIADFIGRRATTIDFSIGYALKSWRDMVAYGEAEERELCY